MEMKIDVKGTILSDSSVDAWVYRHLQIPITQPKNVVEKLEKATSLNEPVDVYINSPGGEIFAGSEIYSALRDFKGNLKIHIVGLAASAASIVACAGHCDMSPTAMMMVHNVQTSASGDYHAMEKEADVLKKANSALCTAYCLKANMSEDEALKMMDCETWLTAKEAVEYKLADSIIEPEAKLVASAGFDCLGNETIEKIAETIKDNQVLKNKIKHLENYISLKEKDIL